MNFNYSGKAEYELHTSLIEEMINLYGVPTKFLVTEKINKDDIVFGDYSHLKSDSSKIYDIYMLPENTENWDEQGYNFTPFGLTNYDTITMFAAKSSFVDEDHNEFDEIVGNLIIFPNNKVMEITHLTSTFPGINNLFTHNDTKSVYKLTCKPYDFKLINEIDNVSLSIDPEVPYETLDVYFQELIGISEDQDKEASITPSVTTIQKTGDIDNKIQKPIIDKTEDSVWGSY